MHRLLAATAAATELSLDALLERLELRPEFLEDLKVGIFLDYMMHKTHREDEFLAMFVFLEQTGGAGLLYHIGDVVMTAEVKIEHLAHFAVLSLDHIYVIRFLICHNSVFLVSCHY